MQMGGKGPERRYEHKGAYGAKARNMKMMVHMGANSQNMKMHLHRGAKARNTDMNMNGHRSDLG